MSDNRPHPRGDMPLKTASGHQEKIGSNLHLRKIQDQVRNNLDQVRNPLVQRNTFQDGMADSHHTAREHDGHDIDLSSFQVGTDLAVEAREMALKQHPELSGVEMEEDEFDGIYVTRIHVINETGARQIGKQPGHYITLEIPGLRNKDTDLQDRVTRQFAREFKQYLNTLGLDEATQVLVIGLGNDHVTADALGPIVVKNLLITRHLFTLMPGGVKSSEYRSVSALSPGVLGTTGIETSEIIFGVVEKTKPDLVIAVDALASRSLQRVNTTIQIADTGINPGSGVGNKRKAVNQQTLGVPVIAIGVPTVVDAATIAFDTMEILMQHLKRQFEEQHRDGSDEVLRQMMGVMSRLEPHEKRQLIQEVLHPLGHNLIVTPKEVDTFIEDIGNIVASGLNAGLHPAIDMQNLFAYTH